MGRGKAARHHIRRCRHRPGGLACNTRRRPHHSATIRRAMLLSEGAGSRLAGNARAAILRTVATSVTSAMTTMET
jgi:hypothetical protein